jgi:hypothetical protein
LGPNVGVAHPIPVPLQDNGGGDNIDPVDVIILDF